MARTFIETRKRGVFGWIFLLMFWAWSALMAVALYVSFLPLPDPQVSSSGVRSGALLGEAIATTMLLSVWASGAVILGLCAMLTRGKKVITEVEL